MIRDDNGKWLDLTPFREPAIFFMENGFYCPEPTGSEKWYDYWYEQRRRCIEGYEYEGERITGDHYFYLNFCPIQKVEDATKKASKKVTGFPDFWDGDYEYFWSREIARNGISLEDYKRLKLKIFIKESALDGGYNLIVGKSRRRGYSYKAAAIATKNYFCIPNSLTLLGASDMKYLAPGGLFGMVYSYISFINDNTAWSTPSDSIHKPAKGHIRASYIEYKDGVKLESGFKSEILCLSYADNPGAARGKDAYDVFFEESGEFGVPGLLKSSYFATMDCVKAGNIKTGMMTVFGTSGSMDRGSVDYADMFERPEAFEFLPFHNIWDENSYDSFVGFFHPANKNLEGFYDSCGNSEEARAKEVELANRQKLISNGATTVEMQKRLQERPLSPSEAFSTTNVNNFPILELKQQLTKIKSEPKYIKRGVPVDLIRSGDEIIAKPILKGANPITTLHNIPQDMRGNFVVFEQPVDNPPKGLYKIGYDPVRQDSGTSLASIIVYKGVHKYSDTKNVIVAYYLGRLNTAEEIDTLAEKIAIYYNTTIMFENEVASVKNYFRRVKRLDLLAAQPDAVISSNIKNSKVARVYGCHMNDRLKDAGERYIAQWLLEISDYDENNYPIRNLDRIYSTRLLEELIAYNRKGNFDMVSSLIMCLIQVQEEELGKEYDENKRSNVVTTLMKRLEK